MCFAHIARRKRQCNSSSFLALHSLRPIEINYVCILLQQDDVIPVRVKFKAEFTNLTITAKGSGSICDPKSRGSYDVENGWIFAFWCMFNTSCVDMTVEAKLNVNCCEREILVASLSLPSSSFCPFYSFLPPIFLSTLGLTVLFHF